ncbi:hypothetical protein D3C75_958880 [compost metagenome]
MGGLQVFREVFSFLSIFVHDQEYADHQRVQSDYLSDPDHAGADGQSDAPEPVQTFFSDCILYAAFHFHSGYGRPDDDTALPKHRPCRQSVQSVRQRSSGSYGFRRMVQQCICLVRCVAACRVGQHYLHRGVVGGGPESV